MVWPARAQALARQPGPRGRFERDRGRGAQRDPHRAELHGRRPRSAAFRRRDRTRLQHRRAPQPCALGPGGVHHHQHGRPAAVGPVPGHAGGDRGRHQRRAPGPDRRLHHHPGRRGGGAGRGLWRPAARRGRERAADGAAEPGVAGAVTRPAGGRGPAAGRQRAGVRADHVPLPLAPRAGGAGGLFARREARPDRGAGGAERRGQEHGVRPAAALLRPGLGPHRAGRRAHRPIEPARSAQPHRHRAAGPGDLLHQRAGKHPLRQARGERRTGARRSECGFRRRVHLEAARGL